MGQKRQATRSPHTPRRGQIWRNRRLGFRVYVLHVEGDVVTLDVPPPGSCGGARDRDWWVDDFRRRFDLVESC